MGYPVKSHSPGGNQLPPKKKQRKKQSDEGPSDRTTASTKVQGKLVELNNIVGFAHGSEEEMKQLRILLSTNDLGILSDYAASE